MPVTGQVLDNPYHARRQDVTTLGEDAGQFQTKEAKSLAHCHSAFQQEGANLVDDAGALAYQPSAHPVQRLKVKLVGRLGGDELHRRTLHRLSNRFGVAEVVLLTFRIRPHIFGWHQTCIVTLGLQLAIRGSLPPGSP
jgi:hypothetical protein